MRFRIRQPLMVLVATSLLLPTAGASDVPPFTVNAQGIFVEQGSEHMVHSPGGVYHLELDRPARPEAGLFRLTLVGPDGARHGLPDCRGTGCLVSDAGDVVTIDGADLSPYPSQIAAFDARGRERWRAEVRGLADATLSSGGALLAYRTRNGAECVDLSTFTRRRYDGPFARIAVSGDGRFLGLRAVTRADGGVRAELVVSRLVGPTAVRGRDGELGLPLELGGPPLALAADPDGVHAFVLTRSELVRIGVPDGERDVILRAESGSRLRDLRLTTDGRIHVGVRRDEANGTRGEHLVLSPEGRLLARRAGPHAVVAAAMRGVTTHEEIPWPLAPNQQHPIGNTYGEYQNYGGAPYMHPGVDFFGDPGQPVYAVHDGEVKAVLTTSGEWHWRVAVANESTSGSSEGYLYAHLEESSIAVDVGDLVAAGQYLGDLVPWPIYDFTHIHFARIVDSGYLWYGNWLCTDNPHLDLPNQTDVEPPEFEPALGTDLLAFCENETSNYLDPASLQGEVDIIAHVGDRILTDWVCTVQEIRYTIYPEGSPSQPVVDDKLSVFYDMVLDTYQGGGIDPFLVDLLYKQDGTCPTYGDYDRREFFHIITNSDGNQVYGPEDVWEAWNTTHVSDGDYVVRVTAWDAAGNAASDSMTVTVANGPQAVVVVPPGQRASIGGVTLVRDEAIIRFTLPMSGPVQLAVFDAAGRRIATLVDGYLSSGGHTAQWLPRSGRGSAGSAGVYLCRLRAGDVERHRRLVVVR